MDLNISAHCECGQRTYAPHCDTCNSGYIKKCYDAFYQANAKCHEQFQTIPTKLDMTTRSMHNVFPLNPNVVTSNPSECASSSHGVMTPSHGVLTPIPGAGPSEFYIATPSGYSATSAQGHADYAVHRTDITRTEFSVKLAIESIVHSDRGRIITPLEIEQIEMNGNHLIASLNNEVNRMNSASAFRSSIQNADEEVQNLLATASGNGDCPVSQYTVEELVEKQEVINSVLAQLRLAYASKDAQRKEQNDLHQAIYKSVIDRQRLDIEQMRDRLQNLEMMATEQQRNSREQYER